MKLDKLSMRYLLIARLYMAFNFQQLSIYEQYLTWVISSLVQLFYFLFIKRKNKYVKIIIWWYYISINESNFIFNCDLLEICYSGHPACDKNSTNIVSNLMKWTYLMVIQYSKKHRYIAIAIRYRTIARVLLC